MFTKLSVSTIALAITATLTFALANAETPANEKATPTPAAKPQNETIVNTTKSNTKDKVTLPSPTPTVKPQNQSIVNTSKSNTKDYKAALPSPTPKSSNQSKADKGWDGKVQGKQKTSPTASPTPAKSR